MKVVHLNNNDFHGGAAKSAVRLHLETLKKGITSRLLVLIKKNNYPYVYTLFNEKHSPIIASIRTRLERLYLKFYPKSKKYSWNHSWLYAGLKFKLQNHPMSILHVHWVSSGVCRISELENLKYPIVWTLHDSWMFTGGCHVVGDCKGFEERCGVCPQLRDCGCGLDISRLGYNSKANLLKNKKDIVFVAPSSWIEKLAKRSSLLREARIEVIPNGIDLELFKVKNKDQAKEFFNISKNKITILFGAVNSTEDKNKGFDLFVDSLKVLSNTYTLKSIEVVVFGNKDVVDLKVDNLTTVSVGFVESEQLMATLYSAADIMCVPSRQESFGQTVIESMACGTPVVAFGGSGIDDIITDKVDGYLVSPFNVNEYSDAIKELIGNEFLRKRLGIKAREKVEQKFDIKNITNKYIDLYSELLITEKGKKIDINCNNHL